jgi:predicted dehydrogenase
LASNVRVAVVGTGFGRQVHVPAFRLAGCEIVAISSPTPANAAKAAAELKIPAHYSDWKKMISESKADIVSIAVPARTQPEVASYALQQSKDIFLEKPLCLDPALAKKLLDQATKAGRAHMVNFELPEMKTWREAKRRLDAGEMGRLKSVEIDWITRSYSRGEFGDSWKFDPSSGGGLLYNFGSHIFHYVEWFFGPIETISCERETVTHSGGTKLDVALRMTIPLESGVTVNVRMNGKSTEPLHRIRLVGEKGELVLENSSTDYVAGFVLNEKGHPVIDEKHTTAHGDGRIWATEQNILRLLEWRRTGKAAHPNLTDAARVEELMSLALAS